MTTLLRARQRAEEFAALVDGTAGDAAAGRDGERLLGVVTTLRRGAELDPSATPRAAFSLDLRERLMVEADVALKPQTATLALPVRTHGRRERRLVAAATAAILLGGTAGMATAAQDALPGEALYPIKRGIEKVDVSLSGSQTARGQDLLSQASRRLEEVRGLMDAGTATGAPQIPATLDTFTTQAHQGADLLMAAYTDDENPKAIDSIRSFAARDIEVLAQLSAIAPPAARSDLHDAALALRDIDAEATRLCTTCDGRAPLRVPTVFLDSAEVDRALGAAAPPQGLDDTPPSLREKEPPAVIEPKPLDDNRSGGVAASTPSRTPSPVVPAPVVPAAPPVPPSSEDQPEREVTEQVDKTVRDGTDPAEELAEDLADDVADELGDVMSSTSLPDPNGVSGLLP